MSENYVLLGGWGRDKRSYKKIIQMCPKNSKFIVIPHDIFIGTEKNPTFESINSNILEEIKQYNLSNFVLLGHSLGGGVAISFTAHNQEYVKKLILIDSEGIPLKRSFILTSMYLVYDNLFLYSLKKVAEGARISKRVFLRFGKYLDLGLFADRMDVEADARKINAPTVVIWGERDKVIPLESAKKLHELIKNSKLKILPKMDHDWILHYPQGLWENI